jgi:hypothetical protein
LGGGLQAPGFPVIDVSQEFPQHHQVQVPDHFRLEGGGIDQGGEKLRRAKIGVKPEVLPQSQDGPLGTARVLQGLPFPPSYRAEQDGIALQAKPDRLLGKGLAHGIDGGTSHQTFSVLKTATQYV